MRTGTRTRTRTRDRDATGTRTGPRSMTRSGTRAQSRTMTKDLAIGLTVKPEQELEPGLEVEPGLLQKPEPQTLGNTWLTNSTQCRTVKGAETVGAKLWSVNATRGWQTVFTVAGLVPDHLSQNRPPARNEESQRDGNSPPSPVLLTMSA